MVADHIKEGINQTKSIGLQGWIAILAVVIPLLSVSFFSGLTVAKYNGLEQRITLKIDEIKSLIKSEFSLRDYKINYSYEQLIKNEYFSKDSWNNFYKTEFSDLLKRVSALERRCDVVQERLGRIFNLTEKIEKRLIHHDEGRN